MATKNAPGTLTVVSPRDILHKHLRQAAAPFADDLKKAAALDVQLAAAAVKINPNGLRDEADKLVERAVAGDKEADTTLEKHGGRDGYITSRGAMYKVREGARCKAAEDAAPMWQKVSDALCGAIETADREIQAQFDRLMTLHGEPTTLSSWNAVCRNMRNGLASAPFHSEKLHHGTDYLVRSLGLDVLLD
jgi:hypothetical protein